MHCGNVIDVYGTKEAWGYVVEVVEIIETKAEVISVLLILKSFPLLCCRSHVFLQFRHFVNLYKVT